MLVIPLTPVGVTGRLLLVVVPLPTSLSPVRPHVRTPVRHVAIRVDGVAQTIPRQDAVVAKGGGSAPLIEADTVAHRIVAVHADETTGGLGGQAGEGVVAVDGCPAGRPTAWLGQCLGELGAVAPRVHRVAVLPDGAGPLTNSETAS